MGRPSWIGYNLGNRYKIEAVLGQGGMSAVYRAIDPNLRRTVAVKLIHSHLTSDEEFVRRFEAEAAAVAQLRHPNIVQVYDFDHDGDTYYMVMEFVPGETLQSRLKTLSQTQQRFPLNATASIISVVADAVAYAHDRGTIHRDLKPANIMLMPGDQPVLTDFGVAKILGGQQHTATGAIIGTPAYMSPEQVRGEPLDGRADIYSLGIVLYEMAAGKPPFEGDSAMTVMLKHVNEQVPDIRSRAEVPPALKDVLDRALAKNPTMRYQTASELAAALRAIAQRPFSTDKEDTVVPNAPPPVGATMIEPVRPATPPTANQPRPMSTIRENLPATQPPAYAAPAYTAPVITPAPPAPPPANTYTQAPAAAAPPRTGPNRLLIGGCIAVVLLCLVVGVGAVAGYPAIMALLNGATATTGVVSQVTDTPQPAVDTATLAPGEPSNTPGAPEDTAVPNVASDTPSAPDVTEAPPDTEVPATDVPTLTPEPTQLVVPDGMLLIPGGTFNMGSGTGDAGPVHAVTVNQFMIDKVEASNQRYNACVDAGACSVHPRSSFTRGNYGTDPSFAQFPVVQVTWDQANAMCQFEGRRLPTEAEWEYAATGGDGRRWPWGNDFDASLVPSSAGDTQPGGSFASGASPFGLYDMAGNVLEWVNDWYLFDFYSTSPSDNPTGPDTGSQKVLRGGSFGNPDGSVYLTTRRFSRNPGGSDVDIGFRCAQSVP